MLGLDPFRHDLIRKYTMVFGALFNQIKITHLDQQGELARTIKVPLSFAPKEKILARLLADPGIDRPAATMLPRMSFELTSLQYNGDNKLRSIGRNVVALSDDKDKLTSMLNPVPYDLKFTLWVFTKYIEDGNQIVEQILPFFVPHFTATVNLLENVNVDCQVRLDGVEMQDVYAGAFPNIGQRRAIMWTLTFTMTGYLFGPERRHPIIKFSNASFYVPEDMRDRSGVEPIDRVTVQPGLTANGESTTNVDISIDYHEIEATDDWDYAVTIYGSLVPGDIGGD